MSERAQIAARFRGYLPVVVDLETGGFNPSGDAILELAAVLVTYDGNRLQQDQLLHYHVAPLPGTNMDPASLRFTGIDPYHPLRKARAEPEVFQEFFREVRKAVKDGGCTRAIVVAHNAAFDHQFIMSGANRNNIKRNPFPPVFVHRHRVAGGSGLWTDGTEPGVLARGYRVRQQRSAFRALRRAGDGAAVLHDRQQVAGDGRLAARMSAYSAAPASTFARAAASLISVFSSPD